MKKTVRRTLALALVLALCLSLVPAIFAADGLSNFKKTQTYRPGTFSDVEEGKWYTDNVKAAYEYGLMQGTGSAFNLNGNITIAETAALVARLHNIYHGGTGEFVQGKPWYKVYVDYAVENGLSYMLVPDNMSVDWAAYAENWPVPRELFAHFLYSALYENVVESQINNITKIPDVENTLDNEAIYALYNAGILTGSDNSGTFYPDCSITRSEVAAVVTRMADPSLRKKFTPMGDTSVISGQIYDFLKQYIVTNGYRTKSGNYNFTLDYFQISQYSDWCDEIGIAYHPSEESIELFYTKNEWGDSTTEVGLQIHREQTSPYTAYIEFDIDYIYGDNGLSHHYDKIALANIDPATFTGNGVAVFRSIENDQGPVSLSGRTVSNGKNYYAVGNDNMLLSEFLGAQMNENLSVALSYLNTGVLRPNGYSLKDLGFQNLG